MDKDYFENIRKAALIPRSIFAGQGWEKRMQTAEPLTLSRFWEAKEEIMREERPFPLQPQVHVSPWLPSTTRVQIEIKRTFPAGTRKGKNKRTTKTYKVWVDQVSEGMYLVDGRLFVSPRMQDAINRMANEARSKIDASVINGFSTSWWE